MTRTVESRVSAAVGILVLAVLLWAHLFRPYGNADVLIYAAGAEGILRRGLWPYAYVFDHKPVLAYVAYMPMALAGRHGIEIQLLSAAFLLGIAALTRFGLKIGPFGLVLILTIGAAALTTSDLSGNSEQPSILLLVAVLAAMLRSRIVLAALLTAAAVNLNYANIPVFGLATGAFLLMTAPRNVIRFGVFVLAWTAVLFAVLYLLGMDVPGYFRLQFTFLQGYKAFGHPASIKFMLKAAAICGVCALLAARIVWSPADRPRKALAVALAAASLGGLIFIVMSSKFWEHYLFLVALPCFVLAAMNWASLKPVGWAFVAVSLLYCSYRIRHGLTDPVAYPAFAQPYRELGAMTEGKTVMSMRASIVPFYYSGILPFHPYVWREHASIMFGPREDDYLRGQLDRSPPFVLTGPNICADGSTLPRSCEALGRNYRPVKRYRLERGGRLQEVAAPFDLFERANRN